jgi:flagellar biosynthesis component FlhA
MGREIFVPLAIVAIVATMLVPLPEVVLNFLLVINFTLAILLLISGLYISEPLKLSVLPTLLLLTTLYRLALNIATTRMILSTGSAGEVVEAFGKVVIQGNVLVGFVIFLIISLVQFIVVAKGSERVAEVSARFTLDALPGKQMSIDADVRAGLLDGESARRKRDDLQAESRFYGSLDGAMKFVKGDAVAGLIITAINIVGGLIMGVVVQELDFLVAFQKYTILTVGDGLLSQIPALLNATAAGIIVTRVTTTADSSVSKDMISQLSALRSVQLLTAFIGVIIACLPGLPAFPFLCMAALLAGFAYFKPQPTVAATPTFSFQPRVVPSIEIALRKESLLSIQQTPDLLSAIDKFRGKIHDKLGLSIQRPFFSLVEDGMTTPQIKIRGVVVKDGIVTENPSLEAVLLVLENVVQLYAAELTDDSMTRRLLDALDTEAPELVSAVVPGVLTVTQLTMILKSLLRDNIGIRHFDIILQAISENGPKALTERVLLEEIRIAMKRVISAKVSQHGVVKGYTVDPVFDVLLAQCERTSKEVPARHLLSIIGAIRELKLENNSVLFVSRGGRRLLSEVLANKGIFARTIAYEEISEGTTIQKIAEISLPSEQADDVIMELAA